ncbi:hypothetical protein OS21_15070 [Dickeya oryzae]
MLMPIAIDMYLPALPVIAKEFSVDPGRVQMTLSSYVLGFAIGQVFYGPMSDSIGRKPVILGGVLIFTLAAAACALSQTVEQLIHMRFLHGLSAASASVVINALLRDRFSKDEFFAHDVICDSGHDGSAAAGTDYRRRVAILAELACHFLDDCGGLAGGDGSGMVMCA